MQGHESLKAEEDHGRILWNSRSHIDRQISRQTDKRRDEQTYRKA